MSSLYPWLENAWQNLVVMKKNRLPHAMIFFAPIGYGKKQLIDRFAQWLLCQKNEQLELPCADCRACSWFSADTHPDIHRVRPKQEKSLIGIEEIRILIENLTRSAHQKKSKIAVIEDAELMTISASNALLKILEEPIGDTIFLLGVNRLSMLPLTIISRCQTMALNNETEDRLVEWIASQSKSKSTDENIRLALNFTLGSPLESLKMIDNDELKDCIDWKEDLEKMQIDQLSISDMLSRWGPLKATNIRWLHSVLRERLLLSDRLSSLDQYKEWFIYQNLLSNMEHRSLQNLNMSLILQNLYTEWCRCYHLKPI